MIILPKIHRKEIANKILNVWPVLVLLPNTHKQAIVYSACFFWIQINHLLFEEQKMLPRHVFRNILSTR